MTFKAGSRVNGIGSTTEHVEPYLLSADHAARGGNAPFTLSMCQPSGMSWHTTPDTFAVGDCIAPGRWGSCVQATGATHPAWEREQVLEACRREVRPSAPSRLTCGYAHRDFENALTYRTNGEFLYRVEVLDPYCADMLWITWIREHLEAGRPDSARTCAAHYWSGTPTTVLRTDAVVHWELLTARPMRVLSADH